MIILYLDFNVGMVLCDYHLPQSHCVRLCNLCHVRSNSFSRATQSDVIQVAQIQLSLQGCQHRMYGVAEQKRYILLLLLLLLCQHGVRVFLMNAVSGTNY